jgi:hypothetical protein
VAGIGGGDRQGHAPKSEVLVNGSPERHFSPCIATVAIAPKGVPR